MQVGDQRDRLGVAAGVRRAVLDHGLLAEILDQRQPVLDARGEDARGGEAKAPQPLRHGEEGANVGRELGDRGVGLAEADDRPLGSGRRHHQDGGRTVGFGQALVQAHRGVALHELAPRLDPAGRVKEGADARAPARAAGPFGRARASPARGSWGRAWRRSGSRLRAGRRAAPQGFAPAIRRGPPRPKSPRPSPGFQAPSRSLGDRSPHAPPVREGRRRPASA